MQAPTPEPAKGENASAIPKFAFGEKNESKSKKDIRLYKLRRKRIIEANRWGKENLALLRNTNKIAETSVPYEGNSAQMHLKGLNNFDEGAFKKFLMFNSIKTAADFTGYRDLYDKTIGATLQNMNGQFVTTTKKTDIFNSLLKGVVGASVGAATGGIGTSLMGIASSIPGFLNAFYS